jgi:hypothetical protein
MHWTIIVGIIVVSLMFTWLIVIEFHTRAFRRNVKVGDPLYFFYGEQRKRGTLYKIEGNVFIVHAGIDEEYKVCASNTFPRLSYRYKS